VSLLDTAVSTLSYLAIFNLNRGYQPPRLPSSAHPSLYPSQVFATRDDWIVVMCFKEKFWQRLAEIIGLAELRDDPRFVDFSARLKNRAELLPLVQARLEEKTTAEWLELLRGQVPCAPVNTVEQALRDEQVLAREMVIEIPSAAWGPLRQTGNPIKMDGQPPRRDQAPALGQDTADVLAAYLGYSGERIAELHDLGAI
jgi:crotonobetainyl-CoA:carnitine CoA-transferase CaiB-like acyl-CoA transferase